MRGKTKAVDNEPKHPTRYALIDAQNTASTTQRMCGFVVDWTKLCAYLKDQKRWGCQRIYLYSGVENGDTTLADEFVALHEKFGCSVRTKAVITYKNPDKTVQFRCSGCGEEAVKVVDMGYRRKSNCDVELTADAMELAEAGMEFMIFTADGDFEYLIHKLIARGCTVRVVSDPRSWVDSAGYSHGRFAKKLKDLARTYPNKVIIMDISRWRELIRKEIDAIETK